MFNKILLIAEGYPVYYGKARESMDYFSSLRFVPEIAMNPAEFLLDLATGQVNDISIPQDLQAPRQLPPDSERNVVKVSSSLYFNIFFFSHILKILYFVLIFCISTCNSSTELSWNPKRKRGIIARQKSQNICN